MTPHRPIWLPAAVISAGAVGAGCLGAVNADLRTKLDQRAAFELRCDASQLRVTPLGDPGALIRSYGVDGCNKRAVYVLSGDGGNWILNSLSEGNATPTVTPTGSPPSDPPPR